jgi:hypothetical protein
MTALRAYRQERDKRGRRIPRHGTIARTIYDLWTGGACVDEIMHRVQRSRNYVLVNIWKSQNADLANAYNGLRSADEARAS